MVKKITAPMTQEDITDLHAGDRVLLSGTIYTARDAAHKRLCERIERGESLPFDPHGSVIYFVGPTPAKPGAVIGSCGPTTSYRMDAYSPLMIEQGQIGMIGKGQRSQEVIDAMKQHGAVYFGATGGAGALLAQCVISSELVAYEDLGAEAIRRLEVRDMPLTVVIDKYGKNLYQEGRTAYLASLEG